MLSPAKRAVLLILLILAPAGVAACGGGDEEASAPAPAEEPAATTLTRSELISAGDGICAEVNAAIGTIQASEVSDETVKTTQIADLYAGVAERLDGLGTPSDGEAPSDVIAAATALGDPAATDPDAALAEFQAAAAEYGFTDCAEDPAAPVATDGDGGAGADSGTGTGSDGGTVEPAPPPAPEPTPAPTPAPTEPPTGGGVAPDSGGGSGGGSGGSSGGISPG
jgi:hypothetical protein